MKKQVYSNPDDVRSAIVWEAIDSLELADGLEADPDSASVDLQPDGSAIVTLHIRRGRE